MQDIAPLLDAEVAQVLAVKVEQIEGDEIEIVLALRDCPAKRGKVWQAGFVGHDRLAVDDGAAEAERPGGLDQVAKLARPVDAGPGVDAHIVAVDEDLRAVAVELYLVNPLVALGWLGDQFGLHRRYELEPAGAGTYNFTHS
ncbi:hypothetical protein MesoLjLa_42310 [Mesorhizobium sp. L-2-11]|nr:hypothetical protein MesoLjLa_42310 [Mesorhizobium sp. L-2-11]